MSKGNATIKGKKLKKRCMRINKAYDRFVTSNNTFSVAVFGVKKQHTCVLGHIRHVGRIFFFLLTGSSHGRSYIAVDADMMLQFLLLC